ncbi:MAG TPA: arsenosugar biosynthesis radical SAM (seleno)protein ArsS [Terrimicrobiaceae bacterium]
MPQVSQRLSASDGTSKEQAVKETFSQTLANHRLVLRRGRTEILQLNLGKLCNLTCIHCHVNAGPKRKEIIDRDTIDRILEWLAATDIDTVDLTGGAPEMVPGFRYLVERLRAMPRVKTIIDRCNLTILLEPCYEWLADFLAAHRLKIVASMPCYEPENVNAQRGNGVFDASIQSLQLLNQLGYGRQDDLILDLVYNPNGSFLPPDQTELESDYKRELKSHFGIEFHHLYTITNMPIGRFASWLKHKGELEAYMQLLVAAFNPASVAGLMCRNTLSVGWRGEVYDCDFNQQLGMQWRNGDPLLLWNIDPKQLEDRPIALGSHCFGCTAGCGSSCSGALT